MLSSIPLWIMAIVCIGGAIGFMLLISWTFMTFLMESYSTDHMRLLICRSLFFVMVSVIGITILMFVADEYNPKVVKNIKRSQLEMTGSAEYHLNTDEQNAVLITKEEYDGLRDGDSVIVCHGNISKGKRESSFKCNILLMGVIELIIICFGAPAYKKMVDDEKEQFKTV